MIGEDEARRAIERAGNDQQLAAEDKAHGRGGQASVTIQQRNDGRHIRAADGDDQQHAERQRDQNHERKQGLCSGMQHQSYGDANGAGEQHEVDEVLAFISQRPLRQDFLQFARGHQAAGNGQAAENDFQRKTAIMKREISGVRR